MGRGSHYWGSLEKSLNRVLSHRKLDDHASPIFTYRHQPANNNGFPLISWAISTILVSPKLLEETRNKNALKPIQLVHTKRILLTTAAIQGKTDPFKADALNRCGCPIIFQPFEFSGGKIYIPSTPNETGQGTLC